MNDLLENEDLLCGSSDRDKAALVGTNIFYGLIEESQRKSKHLLLRSPERGLGHIIKERVPKPGIKMRQLSLPPNPYFSIHHPVFSYIPTGVLAEMRNVLLPCLCIGFSIWWASRPEQSPTMMVGLQSLLVISCFGAQSEGTREALSEPLPSTPYHDISCRSPSCLAKDLSSKSGNKILCPLSAASNLDRDHRDD